MKAIAGLAGPDTGALGGISEGTIQFTGRKEKGIYAQGIGKIIINWICALSV